MTRPQTLTRGEAGILDRLLDPDRVKLSTTAARALLTLEFSREDRRRMHELALKAQGDSLTAEDRAELDGYRRVGLLLSLLKSKVRKRLKVGGRTRTRKAHET
jgi:hypothetical protein